MSYEPRLDDDIALDIELEDEDDMWGDEDD
jgi:hypothetical protein